MTSEEEKKINNEKEPNIEWDKLKWKDFKLNKDKGVPFKIEPPTKEDMKATKELFDTIHKSIKKSLKESKKQKDKIIVETIIDIYNHKYSCYETYKAEMEALIRIAQEHNNKMFFTIEDAPKKWYVEPVIFDKNIFNTAYKLGKKRDKEK